MRPLLIGFFVCINIHLGYAQWTEQDSIWLKYVHKRNAKRNGTWQNYGNLPTPDVISKKKKFERQQAEAAKKDSSLMIQPPID